MSEKKDHRSDKMQSTMKEVDKPFSKDKIQTRRGKSGTSYTYVKAQEYIRKLNDVFGTAWSVREVESIFIGNNYILKRVEICIPDPDNPGMVWCRDGWGGHPFTGDPGDAFKSAHSKAFVKAASMIGIGLQLWGIDSGEEETDEVKSSTIPNVTVVNPGLHNGPPVIPGMPVVPKPRIENVVTPVATPAPSVLTPPPPTFVNKEATDAQVPPVPQRPMGPPPIPPNFSNGGEGGAPKVPMAPPIPLPPQPTAVGFSSGDGRPVTASISLGSTGVNPDNQPIADFQLNGLKGEAVVRGMTDPMELVRLVMGPAAQQFTSIDQLTVKQAQDVLTAVRQMIPGRPA